MYKVCVLCVKGPFDKASTTRAQAASSARSGRPKAGWFSNKDKQATATKVCVLCIKGPYDKASDLDSDTGMLKLWEVEDNRVLKAKADAQDSGRHGNYTVSELNGQLKAMLKLELKAKMPVKTELHKHVLN